jgi:pyridoxine 5-phosphate synthase
MPKKNLSFLKEVIATFQNKGIRTSIFVETDIANLNYVKETGTNRIEFYTEPYAVEFQQNKEAAVEPFAKAAMVAHELNLGINAGHDLNLDNLAYFAQNTPNLKEVSIGHALISDALYMGLEKTIQKYLDALK